MLEAPYTCFAPARSRRHVHGRGAVCRRRGQVLAPVARPGRHRRLPLAKPPLEWSETKNIRWKKEIPGRGAGTPVIWGNVAFCLDGGPGRRERGRSARRARQGSRHSQVRRHGPRPQGRPGRLGTRRPRGHAARGLPPGVGHVGFAVDRHRRHARDRVVRVARHLRVRHEGHAGLAEGSRRQDDAQPVRRGQLSRAARQHARRRLGSPGRVVHRRARQADGGGDAGARRATRSIRGRRRSSSSRADARRSSRAG